MALKECPRCGRPLNPGAIYTAHVSACKRKSEGGKIERWRPGNAAEEQAQRKAATAPKEPPTEQSSMLWDRGEWRGWAVGVPLGQGNGFVRVEADYCGEKTQLWSVADLVAAAEKGRVFFVEPQQALALLCQQLERLPDAEKPIKAIQEAIRHLDQMKQEQEGGAA